MFGQSLGASRSKVELNSKVLGELRQKSKIIKANGSSFCQLKKKPLGTFVGIFLKIVHFTICVYMSICDEIVAKYCFAGRQNASSFMQVCEPIKSHSITKPRHRRTSFAGWPRLLIRFDCSRKGRQQPIAYFTSINRLG